MDLERGKLMKNDWFTGWNEFGNLRFCIINSSMKEFGNVLGGLHSAKVFNAQRLIFAEIEQFSSQRSMAGGGKIKLGDCGVWD